MRRTLAALGVLVLLALSAVVNSPAASADNAPNEWVNNGYGNWNYTVTLTKPFTLTANYTGPGDGHATQIYPGDVGIDNRDYRVIDSDYSQTFNGNNGETSIVESGTGTQDVTLVDLGTYSTDTATYGIPSGQLDYYTADDYAHTAANPLAIIHSACGCDVPGYDSGGSGGSDDTAAATALLLYAGGGLALALAFVACWSLVRSVI